MQLPRGTFHSIKRGIVLHSLLDEMEKSRFTGYCNIRYDAINCTIVLQSGNFLLADYEKIEGEPAWQKIRELLTKKVDASLTTLSDPQLGLCREFNTHATLPETVRKPHHRGVKTATPVVRSGALGPQESPSGTVARKEHPGGPERISKKTSQDSSGSPDQASYFSGASQEKRNEEREEAETIDRDLNALEEMDLDEMTKKIRESCRITVEKLNLEHLIQKMSE
jgi:hypothetical protein